MVIVYWAPNGFASGDPHDVDAFSYASLTEAIRCYRATQEQGETACLLMPNSVVRDTTGKVVLRDTLRAVAMMACKNVGIQNPDVRLTERETTGSPTDGLALSEFVKANPSARVIVCACTKESAEYFAVMYRMTARYVLGFDLRASFVWPTSATPDAKSRVSYRGMRLATVVVGVSRPTFMAWYNLLNWTYQRRLRGFERTIS